MIDTAALVGLNWVALRSQAQSLLSQGNPPDLECASDWYQHEAHEVRMFAVYVLGGLAATHEQALSFLYDRCGSDPSWQANEVLAMAFDRYCADVGYAQALPQIGRWLVAPLPNLRRAVSEGLRPWTSSKRAYFAENPEVAIELLGRLKDDESRYVQESAGNALRDIGRKHPELVRVAVQSWLAEFPSSVARQVIARHALRPVSSLRPAPKA